MKYIHDNLLFTEKLATYTSKMSMALIMLFAQQKPCKKYQGRLTPWTHLKKLNKDAVHSAPFIL